MSASKETNTRDSGEITLFVKTLTGKTLTFYVDVSISVEEDRSVQEASAAGPRLSDHPFLQVSLKF